MAISTKTLRQRFWSKVNVSGYDSCWNWTAYRHFKGYGRFNMGGQNGRIEGAHRVAWMLTFGVVPEGSHICHICDNPPCCNPSHLFMGTNSDNMKDKIAKGRARGGVSRGQEHPMARLTDADVLAIRASNELLRPLGQRYNVSDSTISLVRRRKIWRHI